jgi:hypothetical protein
MAIIAFLQVLNHWGERVVLSIFFLIGGMGVLVLNFAALYKKLKNNSSTLHKEESFRKRGVC